MTAHTTRETKRANESSETEADPSARRGDDGVDTTNGSRDVDWTVDVGGGDDPLSLTPTTVDRFPTTEQECAIVCASGDRTTATWTGVPVSALLSRADAPPETTHVRVVSDDGYSACIRLTDALDAVLAVARDRARLATVERYPTRFVGHDVDGERAVKGVTRVEFVALTPDDDPSELETLSLDDPQYG